MINHRFVAITVLVGVSTLGSVQLQAQVSQTSIRHVAIGDFAFVVMQDGSVIGWGREEYPFAAREPSPQGVLPIPTPISLPGKVRQLAVGGKAAYALMEDGTVLAWGGNDSWQLGNSPTGPTPPRGVVERSRATPILVNGLAEVTQVAAGGRFGIALTADGKVYVWGAVRVPGLLTEFVVGQPVQVPGLEDIVQVAVSYDHCLALSRDGHVWSWGGKNQWGELGRESGEDPWQPAIVPSLDHVVSIAAGGAGIYASGAVREDGTVWVWGGNQGAMMGNGTNPTLGEPGSINLHPMQVKGIAGATSIAMGQGHVAVLLGDGTLRMWGHDGWGQIGIGTHGFYQELPQQPKITNVAAIYLGGSRSVAVRADGTLWMWGPGYYKAQGILGKDQYLPVEVKLQ